MTYPLAVVESKWWKDSNVSVRGLFDLISDIAYNTPHAYHYEMAMSKPAMKEAIPRIGAMRGCKYLYLATHGSSSGLHLYNDEEVSRTDLRNALVKIHNTKGSKLRGLHMGACLFGTAEIAEFLFEKEICVNWIAGYTTKVAWIESSALDLLFFNALLGLETEKESGAVKGACDRLLKIASGLVAELGFAVYVRKPGGGFRNLLQQAHAA